MASRGWLGLHGALAAMLLAAGAAAAADPSQDPAAAAPMVRELVVPGHAPRAERRRQIRAFVKRAPARNNGEALARWTSPVCPVVAGMTREQGEYVLLRLFQVARAAGAPVIEDGRCTVNVFIVATADPEGLVKAWGRRSPGIFTNAQAAEVRAFQETPRPVRAWYNVRLDRLTTSSDSPFEGLGMAANIPVIHHAVDTRLSTNSPYALTSAIVVVDSARAAGTNVGALADYLALSALAQLKPEAASGGAPSILGLFAPAPGTDPPQGLTSWDSAFLHALYQTRLEDLRQASAIAARMDEALSRNGGEK